MSSGAFDATAADGAQEPPRGKPMTRLSSLALDTVDVVLDERKMYTVEWHDGATFGFTVTPVNSDRGTVLLLARRTSRRAQLEVAGLQDVVPGDMLIAIGDEKVYHLGAENATKYLRSVRKPVRLTLQLSPYGNSAKNLPDLAPNEYNYLWEDGPLGIVLTWDSKAKLPMVKRLSDKANDIVRRDVEVSDQLIYANDVPASEYSMDELMSILREMPKPVLLRFRKQLQDDHLVELPDLAENEYEFLWDYGPLGLVVGMSRSGRPFVRSFTGLGTSHQLGLVQENDEIVMVNDRSTREEGFRETMQYLMNVPKPAVLRFRRHPRRSDDRYTDENRSDNGQRASSSQGRGSGNDERPPIPAAVGPPSPATPAQANVPKLQTPPIDRRSQPRALAANDNLSSKSSADKRLRNASTDSIELPKDAVDRATVNRASINLDPRSSRKENQVLSPVTNSSASPSGLGININLTEGRISPSSDGRRSVESNPSVEGSNQVESAPAVREYESEQYEDAVPVESPVAVVTDPTSTALNGTTRTSIFTFSYEEPTDIMLGSSVSSTPVVVIEQDASAASSGDSRASRSAVATKSMSSAPSDSHTNDILSASLAASYSSASSHSSKLDDDDVADSEIGFARLDLDRASEAAKKLAASNSSNASRSSRTVTRVTPDAHGTHTHLGHSSTSETSSALASSYSSNAGRTSRAMVQDLSDPYRSDDSRDHETPDILTSSHSSNTSRSSKSLAPDARDSRFSAPVDRTEDSKGVATALVSSYASDANYSSKTTGDVKVEIPLTTARIDRNEIPAASERLDRSRNKETVNTLASSSSSSTSRTSKSKYDDTTNVDPAAVARSSARQTKPASNSSATQRATTKLNSKPAYVDTAELFAEPTTATRNQKASKPVVDTAELFAEPAAPTNTQKVVKPVVTTADLFAEPAGKNRAQAIAKPILDTAGLVAEPATKRSVTRKSPQIVDTADLVAEPVKSSSRSHPTVKQYEDTAELFAGPTPTTKQYPDTAELFAARAPTASKGSMKPKQYEDTAELFAGPTPGVKTNTRTIQYEDTAELVAEPPSVKPASVAPAQKPTATAPVDVKKSTPQLTTASSSVSSVSGEPFKIDESAFYQIQWTDGPFGSTVREAASSTGPVMLITKRTGKQTCAGLRRIVVGDILVRIGDKDIPAMGFEKATRYLRKVAKPVALTFQAVD